MIKALTTINFAEEQVKDKYCKTARDKYEKACKKQETLQDSLEIMRQSSLDEDINDDSLTKDMRQMTTMCTTMKKRSLNLTTVSLEHLPEESWYSAGPLIGPPGAVVPYASGPISKTPMSTPPCYRNLYFIESG